MTTHSRGSTDEEKRKLFWLTVLEASLHSQLVPLLLSLCVVVACYGKDAHLMVKQRDMRD